MENTNKLRLRVLWMTRTAVLVALLIALQWATVGTQAFAGQYITGSLVNCVLAVAALFGGLWSGVVVAVVSPFCAYLLGIGPKLIQIVPCIALGNVVFVVYLHLWLGRTKRTLLMQISGLALAAVAKFALLLISVVRIVVPLMAETIPEQQVKLLSAMFSWPQLITALIGGTLAFLVLPVLNKALKKK